MHVVVYLGGLRFRNGSSFSQGVFVFVMGLRFRRGLRFRNESSYSQGVFVFVGGLRFRRGSSFSQGVFVFVGGSQVFVFVTTPPCQASQTTQVLILRTPCQPSVTRKYMITRSWYLLTQTRSISCVDGRTMSEGRKSSRLSRWLEAGNRTDFWLGFYTFIDF